MSAKPSVSPPVWDSSLLHVVAITGGHATSGFINGEVPGSGELNDILNKSGQWLKYLADGDLVLGDVNLTGLNLGSAINVAIANGANNDLDTGGTYSGACLFALTGGGASAQITGIDSADATEGRIIVVVNETTQPVLLVAESSASAAKNRIDLQAVPSGSVVTMPPKGAFLARYSDPPTGRWEILLANFVIDATVRTTTTDYPASVYREIGAAAHTLNQNFLALSTTGGDVIFPVEVAEGDTIVAWTFRMEKVGSSATYVVDLRKVDTTTGAVSTVGSADTNSAISPGFIVLSQSGLTEVAQHACVYFLRLVGAPSPDNDDLVYGCSISTTRTGL